jgi:hypothetical protein
VVKERSKGGQRVVKERSKSGQRAVKERSRPAPPSCRLSAHCTLNHHLTTI